MLQSISPPRPEGPSSPLPRSTTSPKQLHSQSCSYKQYRAVTGRDLQLTSQPSKSSFECQVSLAKCHADVLLGTHFVWAFSLNWYLEDPPIPYRRNLYDRMCLRWRLDNCGDEVMGFGTTRQHFHRPRMTSRRKHRPDSERKGKQAFCDEVRSQCLTGKLVAST
jgi:hypothetical protein